MGKTYTLAPRVPFEPLPTGEYAMRLVKWHEEVEERDSQYSKRGDVKLVFTWQVAIPGAEPEERRSYAKIPQSRSLKSTFYQIALVLGLVDDSNAEESEAVIDFDQGIGRRCIGTIVKSLKDDGKTWTDRITAYSRYDAGKVPTRRGELNGREDSAGRRADLALSPDIDF